MTRDTIPQIGLGTTFDDDPAVDIIETTLDLGYRHVDTAQVYETEDEVGWALERSDVPREEVFVATKTAHIDRPGPGREPLVESAYESRDALGVDVIDLVYVHWPLGNYDPQVTLPALDDLRNEGLIDHIGLSNFSVELLDEARDVLDAPVFAHQVETHPLLQQDELREYANEHDIHHVAFSPLQSGGVFDVPELTTIAEKHGVSEAQVSLAWLLSKPGVHPISKSTSTAHLRANLKALDLELDDEDIDRIDAIDREERGTDRGNAPWNE